MMMVPYMFNDDLMDDLFNDNWERDFDRAMHSMQPRHMFGKRSANVMKTDVRETKDGYDVFVDLPGFKKEDVKLDLQNGYLTITANRSEDLDEKDNEGRYIRQERCTGSGPAAGAFSRAAAAVARAAPDADATGMARSGDRCTSRYSSQRATSASSSRNSSTPTP